MRRESTLQSALVRGFARLRAVVLGDAMLDVYLEGSATRLCPYGPVPVVRTRSRHYVPGGAANTAANARALGASVALVAAVGRDQAAHRLQADLSARGVETAWLVEDPARPTTTKLWLRADRQLIARFDDELAEDLPAPAEQAVIAALRELVPACDVVIVADYLKGVCTPAVVRALNRLVERYQRPVVLDSKDLRRRRFRHLVAVTPNLSEAELAAGLAGSGRAGPSEWPGELLGRRLLARLPARWVVVTAGEQGAMVFGREQPVRRVAARVVEPAYDVGAGDTFTATLALALAAGGEIRTATALAMRAAEAAVAREGTACVSAAELLRSIAPADAGVEAPVALAPVGASG